MALSDTASNNESGDGTKNSSKDDVIKGDYKEILKETSLDKENLLNYQDNDKSETIKVVDPKPEVLGKVSSATVDPARVQKVKDIEALKLASS